MEYWSIGALDLEIGTWEDLTDYGVMYWSRKRLIPSSLSLELTNNAEAGNPLPVVHQINGGPITRTQSYVMSCRIKYLHIMC